MLLLKKWKFNTILIVFVICTSLLFCNTANAAASRQVSINVDTQNGNCSLVTRSYDIGVVYPTETNQYTTDSGNDPLVGANFYYTYIVDIPIELFVSGALGKDSNNNNIYYGYLNGNYSTTYSATFTVYGSYSSSTLRVKLYDSNFNNNIGIATAINTFDSYSTPAVSFSLKTSFFNWFKDDTTSATAYELGSIKVIIQYVGANDGAHHITFGQTTLVNSSNSVSGSPYANSDYQIAGQVQSAIDASGSIDEIASILYSISDNTYLLNSAVRYLSYIDADLIRILDKLEAIRAIDYNSYVRLGNIYDILYDYIYTMNTEDTEAQSELQEAEEEMSHAEQDLDIDKPSLGMIFDNADTIFNEDLTTAQGTIMQFLTFQPIFSILLICFTIAIISYIIYGKSG